MNEVLRFFHVAVATSGQDVFHDLNFHVLEGEALGLLGLPKDTEYVLQRLLAGYAPPTQGSILHADEINFTTATNLWHGLYDILSESSLVSNFSAAENLLVFNKHTPKKPFINHRRVKEKAQAMLDALLPGLIDATRLVSELSRFERCVVEICKALYANARLIIFDNLVDRFSERDRRNFLVILNILRLRKISVIIISNNMQVMQQLCNRICVIRQGRTVKILEPPQCTTENMVACLTGDIDKKERRPSTVKPGEILLEARGLSLPLLKDKLNLYVQRGEIVGIIDRDNSQATMVIDQIFSPGSKGEGDINVLGQVVSKKLRAAYRAGISLMVDTAATTSLLQHRSIQENIMFPALCSSSRPFGIIRQRFLQDESNNAAGLLELDLAAGPAYHSIDLRLRTLLARNELQFHPLLLMKNPTRWLEHEHTQLVYQYMRTYAARGNGILFSSSDMAEVQNICDRYYVIHNSRVTEEVNQ